MEAKRYEPLISICIPTYNRAGDLPRAMWSGLDQRYKNIEVIVADDGSTDDTKEVVSRFIAEWAAHAGAGIRDQDKITYLYKPHTNGADTRNLALQHAGGEFVVWLGSDDVLLPNALEDYIEMLNGNRDADVIYGNFRVVDVHFRGIRDILFPDWENNNRLLLSELVFENLVPDGGSLIRKSLYQDYGHYNAEFARAHDYEWWSRAAGTIRFRRLDTFVYFWRWHAANMSSGSVEVDRSFDARIVRSLLEKHSIFELFPVPGLENNKRELSQIYFRVGRRFLGLQATADALHYFKLAYEANPRAEIQSILLGMERGRRLKRKLKSSCPPFFKTTSRAVLKKGLPAPATGPGWGPAKRARPGPARAA